MKLLAKLWWVLLLILVATWYSHGKARDEVEEFESYYGGCSGFAEGLVHGFIGTGEAQMNRIETRYSELLSNERFWRNGYYLSWIGAIVCCGCAANERRKAG